MRGDAPANVGGKRQNQALTTSELSSSNPRNGTRRETRVDHAPGEIDAKTVRSDTQKWNGSGPTQFTLSRTLMNLSHGIERCLDLSLYTLIPEPIGQTTRCYIEMAYRSTCYSRTRHRTAFGVRWKRSSGLTKSWTNFSRPSPRSKQSICIRRRLAYKLLTDNDLPGYRSQQI